MKNLMKAVMWTPRRAVAALLVITVAMGVVVAVARDYDAQRRYAAELAQYEEDLAAYQAQQERQANIRGIGEPPGGPAGPPGNTRPRVSPPPGPSRAQEGTDDTDQAPAGDSGGVQVAVKFSQVFHAAAAYPNTYEWVTALEPLVAPGLVRYLRITPPEAVPPAPTSAPVSDSGPFSATTEWDLSATGEVFRVVTADTGDGWVVVDYGVTPAT